MIRLQLIVSLVIILKVTVVGLRLVVFVRVGNIRVARLVLRVAGLSVGPFPLGLLRVIASLEVFELLLELGDPPVLLRAWVITLFGFGIQMLIGSGSHDELWLFEWE